MKTMLRKDEISKEYLKELSELYDIELDYGDILYQYDKPIPLLLKKSKTGIQYLENNGEKLPFYVISCELPESKNTELTQIRLLYASLHRKYSLWSWNQAKELVKFEFLNETSVKELLKIVDTTEETND